MRDEEKCCGSEAMAPMTNMASRGPTPLIPLFVIRKRHQEQYWNCSSEHGSGWNDRHPKQSFSPSELATQVGHLARENWCDIVVIQLICS